MKAKPTVVTACLALGLVLMFGSVARAQTDTGAIVGTVKDQSGSVIPGVTITITHEGTGLVYTVVTNHAGQYVFPSLRIGTYTVAAELEGFRRAVRPKVDLNVQGRLDISFSLELGELTAEVLVEGRAALLQTQTADVGYSVNKQQIQDLPLLGRRYAELAMLAPGVVIAPGGMSSRGEDTFFNSNGNFATQNNFTLDGADNNSFSTNMQERSAQVIQPSVDALEEFRVQTRTYSAEFGKAAGAVINASIKQGTNAFKGSVYEFFRDDALNANRWEANRAGLPKGPYDQHIAGATLGGPIVKGSFFFFGDYQVTRTKQTLTNTATVPTPLQRQGDFSEYNRAMQNSPFIPAGCINTQTKTVNLACFDPVAVAAQKLYPQPNIPAALAKLGVPNGMVTPNFSSNGVLKNDVDQFDLRLDYKRGADSFFGRYSFMDTRRWEPPTLVDVLASGDWSSKILNRGQSGVFGWSRVFGSSMFNEVRFAWNRISSKSMQHTLGTNVNAQYGIKGVPVKDTHTGGLPSFNISGWTRLGGPNWRPQYQTSQVYQISDNFTWTKGSHNLKLGFERRRDKVDYLDLYALNGALSFSSSLYSNIGYADFLLGLVSGYALTLEHWVNLYNNGTQLYAQDSWRALPNLTLNYGMRYEYFPPMYARDNKLTNIIPETGKIMYARDSGSTYERTLINPDKNDFAPRLGFAWTVTPRTVVRGGFGIFYQQTDRYGSESQLALNPPQLVDYAPSAPNPQTAPLIQLQNGFPAISAANIDPTRVQWRIQDPDQVTPIIYQYSVGPEFQLTQNMAAGVQYVANKARNGRRLRNLNQGQIVSPGVVVFPYAQYGFGSAFLEQMVTTGVSDYDALQFQVRRRMSKGLAFNVNFTWSKGLGNFMDHLTGGAQRVPQNIYDPRGEMADYGPLAFDTPRRLVASFMYELPWGAGRALEPKGVVGALIGNWSVNGIFNWYDGSPLTVGGTDRTNTGSGHSFRANCIGDPVPDGFEQTVDHWFDTKAFASPVSGTFGNCGVGSLRGPSRKSMNLSIFRFFPLGQDRRLEFRVETFNTFNWNDLGNPGTNVDSPSTFGVITGRSSNPRELQLAVKFYF